MSSIEKIMDLIDITYASQFAKRMETFRCHPELGYRTAGSQAEWQTGEMIAEEMRKIGLSAVTKDEITLDGWTFSKAHLSFKDDTGHLYRCELGGYQTQFETKGPKSYELVYLNKGTEADYQHQDVTGKLVLIDINQRDEWWINFPVYQAYLKGAAAVLAAQSGGYGEVHPEALNAQDIAGPKEAAAFSISQKDADYLKAQCRKKGKITVTFDAASIVTPHTHTYNIIGKIPGKLLDRQILFSGHYDSYFSGFQDDNAAIGMLLGIAKAVIESGYQPQKTWVFCAMAAEEWGVCNSKYDWSTGAYEEIFTVHPKWHTQTDIDFNFELPAYAHGKKDYIRCIYEYQSFIRSQVKNFQPPADAYPEGIGVISPIETWSDDFSIAINGIPSLVNEFSSGGFMETHYHSQFDNETVYHHAVYDYHHKLYAHLGVIYDQTAVLPFQFKTLLSAFKRSLSKITYFPQTVQELIAQCEKGMQTAQKLYDKIIKINNYGQALYAEGKPESLTRLMQICAPINQNLLQLFKQEQDHWVRLNWHDSVHFPHTLLWEKLTALQTAITALKQKDRIGTLKALYHIDNNRYAFLFSQEVYDYFTQYVLDQPADRLKWGYGRLMPHENLYTLVQELKEQVALDETFYLNAKQRLEGAFAHQKQLLQEALHQELQEVKNLIPAFEDLTGELATIDLDNI